MNIVRSWKRGCWLVRSEIEEIVGMKVDRGARLLCFTKSNIFNVLVGPARSRLWFGTCSLCQLTPQSQTELVSLISNQELGNQEKKWGDHLEEWEWNSSSSKGEWRDEKKVWRGDSCWVDQSCREVLHQPHRPQDCWGAEGQSSHPRGQRRVLSEQVDPHDRYYGLGLPTPFYRLHNRSTTTGQVERLQ